MKTISRLLNLLLVVLPLFTCAQDSWWVNFTDKKGVSFDPYTYFDQKAIDRRIRNGIPLNDFTDWPLNEQYVSRVGQLSDSILLASRWFNAVAVDASENQIRAIRLLPFVASVEKLEEETVVVASLTEYDTTLSDGEMEVLRNQTLSMQGDLFEKAGINGKGVRVAIFDVGFPGAKENPAFQEIIKEGRLIASKDFSRRKGEDVFWGKSHGTQVWSCIAGKVGDQRIGLATGAEFLLAKTEVNREPFSEELHWLAAAEWADKNGADIINSSLGYTKNRYFPWQMDGHYSFITRAANLAARKGILVVNAAGNEGQNGWHTVGAPADADSVLSVGGIAPETGYHTSFSSYGPTADRRMKPNVSAYGHVIASGSNGFISAMGTSFASPLVAGFAACALQLNKDIKNMDLFLEIEKSGHLYPYFDYAHGYGVPQAAYFLGQKATGAIRTFSIENSSDTIRVLVKPQFIPVAEAEDTEESAQQFNKNLYLYYNVMDHSGVIKSYYVVAVTEPEVLIFDRSEFQEGELLNVHFAGFTESISF